MAGRRTQGIMSLGEKHANAADHLSPKSASSSRYKQVAAAWPLAPAPAQRRGRQLFPLTSNVMLLVTVLVLPLATAQFCPLLKNPGYVYGVEDEELNMQSAWMQSAVSAADRMVAGKLWHGECPSTVCGTCLGTEEAIAGQDFAQSQHIRVEYSVQYGRLFLADGYLQCGLVVDDAEFDFGSVAAEAESTRKSFSVTGTYDVVNCTMQYLTFQGLRFANKMTQLANYGKQPQVLVKVEPPRTDGPSQTGLQFIYSTQSRTFVVMEEINSLPNLEVCPTMHVEKHNALAPRYPEQYASSVVASANSPELLHWEPSRGGERCKNTPLPGVPGVLLKDLPPLVPRGWQEPSYDSTGSIVGLTSQVHGGTTVAPMKIVPAFCQIDEVRIRNPPYCDTLSEQGHTSCSPDPVSYVYHFEDYEDATLRINGIRMWDKDLWTGHIDTTFAFRFRPLAQDGVSFKLNDPFDHESREPVNIEAGSGIFSAFCARPYYDPASRAAQHDTSQLKADGQSWNTHCASSWTEAISDILPLDKTETKLYVIDRADRTPLTAFDQTNCDMVECVAGGRFDCDVNSEGQQQDNKWKCSSLIAGQESVRCMVVGDVRDAVCFKNGDRCICNSLVYSRATINGQQTWTTVLFWQLADRNNRTKIYETGYLRMTYNNQSIIDGTLWADPQTLPYQSIPDGNGLPFDWFRASPMSLRGKVASSDNDVYFTVDASTKPIVNPLFTMTLQAAYGNVSLPNNPSHTPPIEQNRSMIKLVGTMSDLNAALSVVEYRVPGWPFPNFHTMSNKHSIYGHVEEELSLKVDDGGNSGAPSVYGEATRMQFNLVVVAVNDEPVVSGPNEYSDMENTWFSLELLGVNDLDARDRLTRNETASGASRTAVTELKLQLASTFGRFRIATNYTEELNLLQPIPGSLRPVPGEPEPCLLQCGAPQIISSYSQLLAIRSQVCRGCLETYAKKRVALEGSQVVEFEGDVSDCNVALRRSEYKGDPGFNSNIPSSGDAFTLLGDQTPSFGDPKAREFIEVTATDLGNTGCTSVASLQGVQRTEVILQPVETMPFLMFFQNGYDMCDICKSDDTCGEVCPEGTPKVYSDESALLEFNESFSPQIRDFDTRDTSLQLARYTLYIKVQQGVLIIPDAVTLAGKDTAQTISGLTYAKGTEGCLTCSEFELSGTLFELNKVLIGLRYQPIRFYNSQFGSEEQLMIRITQTGPVALAGIEMNVIIFVLAVNDAPTLNRFIHGSSASLAVKDEFYDIVFMGPSRTEYCMEDKTTCLSLTDPDACESMYIASGIMPGAEETIRVQMGLAPICLDSSLAAGKIRVNVRCTYGNVWFFSPEEVKTWPPDANLVPKRDPGKEERNLTLNRPLSQYVGGVLRYYPSPSSSKTDTVIIEVDDNGNTGKPAPSTSSRTFCCCADSKCETCVPGVCNYQVDVSSCSTVPGWLCLDSQQSGAGLPGEALTAVAIVGVVAVVAAFAGVIHAGQQNSAVNQAFRAKDPETLEEQKRSISKWVQQHSQQNISAEVSMVAI